MAKMRTSSVTRNGDGTVSVVFDESVYSGAAVKTALYKFAADMSALVSKSEEHVVEARLTFPPGTSEDAREKLIGALCNEVIDQDLREQIRRETEGTRNLILAEAFSKTSLLHEE